MPPGRPPRLLPIARNVSSCSVSFVADLPIACSLSGREAEHRRLEWQGLFSDALRRQVETPTGMMLAFAASADVERRLERLVELERRCCAFARWTIAHQSDEVVLRIDGEGDGAAAVQEPFRR
jgi:hypothetical protein